MSGKAILVVPFSGAPAGVYIGNTFVLLSSPATCSATLAARMFFTLASHLEHISQCLLLCSCFSLCVYKCLQKEKQTVRLSMAHQSLHDRFCLNFTFKMITWLQQSIVLMSKRFKFITNLIIIIIMLRKVFKVF